MRSPRANPACCNAERTLFNRRDKPQTLLAGIIASNIAGGTESRRLLWLGDRRGLHNLEEFAIKRADTEFAKAGPTSHFKALPDPLRVQYLLNLNEREPGMTAGMFAHRYEQRHGLRLIFRYGSLFEKTETSFHRAAGASRSAPLGPVQDHTGRQSLCLGFTQTCM